MDGCIGVCIRVLGRKPQACLKPLSTKLMLKLQARIYPCPERDCLVSKKVTFRCVFICLFLLSFSYLFWEEGPLRYNTHDYASLIPPDLLIEDAWYGVYFQDSFLGYSHYFIKINEIKEGGGYVLKNDAHLRFPIMGRLEPLDITMAMQLLSNYSLEKGVFAVQSNNYFFTASLTRKEHDTYAFTIETPSEKTTRTMNRKGEIINPMFSPISLNYVPLKKKLFYTFYDPFLNRETNVTLENRGKETILMKGQSLVAYKIDMDADGVKGTIFVDNNGRLLKEEFLGFTFVKELPQELFNKKSSSPDIDVTSSFSIPSRYIAGQEGLSYMKARIEGVASEFIREDFNQKLTPVENACFVEIHSRAPKNVGTLPLKVEMFDKYLGEETFIKFRTPLVTDTVNSIVGEEKDAFAIVKRITIWINNNIEKIPSITLPSTTDVLKLKRGDCGELSALMVGFLRSVGIPSYVNIGIVLSEGRFFYHAWVSAYIGEWIDTDPALEQLIADPTHIKLLKGLENQFELFKVIPKIKVEILDYR